jgi:hypothetical protein
VIWDCFMLSDELDMLELRLTELQEYPDVRHVLVESPQTHQGDPKPLYYRDFASRFACWQERIVYLAAEPEPHLGAWGRERHQRDWAWHVLAAHTQPDDLVLAADVDEIPSPAVLAAQPSVAVALQQRVFHSAVDWEYPEPQRTSVLARAGYLAALPGRLTALRGQRDRLPLLANGGWHFSWLGTAAQRQAKLRSTCHRDMPAAEWSAIFTGDTWQTGRHHASDAAVKPTDVDETWPAYVRERRCPASWFRPRET